MKKAVVTATILIIEIFSAFIASGIIIVLGGSFSFFLWLLPIAVSVISIKKKLLYKELAMLLLILYIIISSISLTKNNLFGRKMIQNWCIGSNYYTVYEINPGAAGHFSYEKTTYYNILDTQILFVRVIQSKESYKNKENIPH